MPFSSHVVPPMPSPAHPAADCDAAPPATASNPRGSWAPSAPSRTPFGTLATLRSSDESLPPTPTDHAPSPASLSPQRDRVVVGVVQRMAADGLRALHALDADHPLPPAASPVVRSVAASAQQPPPPPPPLGAARRPAAPPEPCAAAAVPPSGPAPPPPLPRLQAAATRPADAPQQPRQPPPPQAPRQLQQQQQQQVHRRSHAAAPQRAAAPEPLLRRTQPPSRATATTPTPERRGPERGDPRTLRVAEGRPQADDPVGSIRDIELRVLAAFQQQEMDATLGVSSPQPQPQPQPQQPRPSAADAALLAHRVAYEEPTPPRKVATSDVLRTLELEALGLPETYPFEDGHAAAAAAAGAAGTAAPAATPEACRRSREEEFVASMMRVGDASSGASLDDLLGAALEAAATATAPAPLERGPPAPPGRVARAVPPARTSFASYCESGGSGDGDAFDESDVEADEFIEAEVDAFPAAAAAPSAAAAAFAAAAAAAVAGGGGGNEAGAEEEDPVARAVAGTVQRRLECERLAQEALRRRSLFLLEHDEAAQRRDAQEKEGDAWSTVLAQANEAIGELMRRAVLTKWVRTDAASISSIAWEATQRVAIRGEGGGGGGGGGGDDGLLRRLRGGAAAVAAAAAPAAATPASASVFAAAAASPARTADEDVYGMRGMSPSEAYLRGAMGGVAAAGATPSPAAAEAAPPSSASSFSDATAPPAPAAVPQVAAAAQGGADASSVKWRRVEEELPDGGTIVKWLRE